MKRCLYRAEGIGNMDAVSGLREERIRFAAEKAMERQHVSRMSFFANGSGLFLYYECLRGPVRPESLLPEADAWLAAWPGAETGRRWAPMIDIFHYQSPVSELHWKRKNENSLPYGRIARLKPEEAASYVYYHYQYQEERPGDGDKYGIIGMHETVLFFYSELPATIEPAPYEGKLNTKLRPDNWAEVMEPHFIKWGDVPAGQEIWRELELVLDLRVYDERKGMNDA